MLPTLSASAKYKHHTASDGSFFSLFSHASYHVSAFFHSVRNDRNSRNLFAFLVINLSFAFVELFYGFLTNSLGLISDSFHMFFDCSALLTGLIAQLISKRPPRQNTYSFGFARAEIVGGFLNAVLLLYVAFFIFAEAVERLGQPPEVKHERLLPVSVLGLIVNLVGIFVFNHGGSGDCHHGHSHGGGLAHTHSDAHEEKRHHHDNQHHHHDLHHHHHHGHSHQNGGSQVAISLGDSGGSPANQNAAAASSSPNRIMQGVWLHLLADTLGSVGVIISSLLISQFGMLLADPVCSLIISLLIAGSVWPLLRDSLAILMMRTPTQLETRLPGVLARVCALPGVASVAEVHVWTLATNNVRGEIRLEMRPRADWMAAQRATQQLFVEQLGVSSVCVQVEFPAVANENALTAPVAAALMIA